MMPAAQAERLQLAGPGALAGLLLQLGSWVGTQGSGALWAADMLVGGGLQPARAAGRGLLGVLCEHELANHSQEGGQFFKAM